MALTPPNVQFNATDRGSQYMFKLNAIAQAIDLAVNGFNQQLAAANDANLFAQTAQTAATTATTKASEVETARAQVASNTATVNTKANEVETARAQVATNAATVNTKASEVETKRAQVAANATAAQGYANAAADMASAATSQANRAESEADRAQAAADAASSGFVLNTDARLSDAREWTADTVSQAEAETGTADTRRAWTSQRVRQAVAAFANAKAPVLVTSNITLAINTPYHVSGNRTLTLPTGSPQGSRIRLTKNIDDIVTINRGGSELIKWPGGTDTQVIFNINAEIVFTRNAAGQWEIKICL